MSIYCIQEIENKNNVVIFIIKENRVWTFILSSFN